MSRSTVLSSSHQLSSSRILIVDDQPEIRELVAVTLRFGNFVIDKAADGAEAMRLAKAAPPDLIILDVSFPSPPDGVEICQMLKSEPTTAKAAVVMLTSFREAELRAAAEAAGAIGFLNKPFSPLELTNLVRRLLC